MVCSILVCCKIWRPERKILDLLFRIAFQNITLASPLLFSSSSPQDIFWNLIGIFQFPRKWWALIGKSANVGSIMFKKLRFWAENPNRFYFLCRRFPQNSLFFSTCFSRLCRTKYLERFEYLRTLYKYKHVFKKHEYSNYFKHFALVSFWNRLQMFWIKQRVLYFHFKYKTNIALKTFK